MTDTHDAAHSGRPAIGHSTVDGIRVVTLSGEIDHTVRDRLGRALLPPDDAARPRTVIDLSGVTFMDSSGINALINAHHATVDADGWLRLAGPRESVVRIMRLVGIDRLIPCYPDLRQALGN
ncbi:STAS domain-containing protein [Streptomyces sp. NPDC004542]|uniref:STAS domain-containing protein n=1 Tax=Streptomyces sp. NPDC004542 TaxID=3154281 RepID=UPI0033B9921D